MGGVADVFGGAAERILYNSLYDMGKELIGKNMIMRSRFNEVLSTLDSYGPLIKKIEASNEELGLPKEEVEKFKAHLEEGIQIVKKCSKVRKWNFYKKLKYAVKFISWHDRLEKLGDVLIKQVERIQRNQRANLDSIKKKYTAGAHTKVEMIRRMEIALSRIENLSRDVRAMEDQVKRIYCLCVCLFILLMVISVSEAGSSPGTKFGLQICCPPAAGGWSPGEYRDHPPGYPLRDKNGGPPAVGGQQKRISKFVVFNIGVNTLINN